MKSLSTGREAVRVHYCRPEAQGPFYNFEAYRGWGNHNTIGPYAQLDEAVDDAKRRILGCPTLMEVRVRRDLPIYGKNEKNYETVAIVGPAS